MSPPSSDLRNSLLTLIYYTYAMNLKELTMGYTDDNNKE